MTASHVGQVAIELLPDGAADLQQQAARTLWRDATGPIPESVDVNFTLSIMNRGAT